MSSQMLPTGLSPVTARSIGSPLVKATGNEVSAKIALECSRRLLGRLSPADDSCGWSSGTSLTSPPSHSVQPEQQQQRQQQSRSSTCSYTSNRATDQNETHRHSINVDALSPTTRARARARSHSDSSSICSLVAATASPTHTCSSSSGTLPRNTNKGEDRRSSTSTLTLTTWDFNTMVNCESREQASSPHDAYPHPSDCPPAHSQQTEEGKEEEEEEETKDEKKDEDHAQKPSHKQPEACRRELFGPPESLAHQHQHQHQHHEYHRHHHHHRLGGKSLFTRTDSCTSLSSSSSQCPAMPCHTFSWSRDGSGSEGESEDRRSVQSASTAIYVSPRTIEKAHAEVTDRSVVAPEETLPAVTPGQQQLQLSLRTSRPPAPPAVHYRCGEITSHLMLVHLLPTFALTGLSPRGAFMPISTSAGAPPPIPNNGWLGSESGACKSAGVPMHTARRSLQRSASRAKARPSGPSKSTSASTLKRSSVSIKAAGQVSPLASCRSSAPSLQHGNTGSPSNLAATIPNTRHHSHSHSHNFRKNNSHANQTAHSASARGPQPTAYSTATTTNTKHEASPHRHDEATHKHSQNHPFPNSSRRKSPQQEAMLAGVLSYSVSTAKRLATTSHAWPRMPHQERSVLEDSFRDNLDLAWMALSLKLDLEPAKKSRGNLAQTRTSGARH